MEEIRNHLFHSLNEFISKDLIPLISSYLSFPCIVVFGGFSRSGGVTQTCEIFDGKKWSDFPCPSLTSAGGGVVYHDGKIYHIGGRVRLKTDRCEIFNLNTKKWSSMIPMKVPHEDFIIGIYQNEIFIFSSDSESYDIHSNVWNSIQPKINVQLTAYTGIFIHDKVYFLGGLVNSWGTHNCTSYDLKLKIWTQIAPMHSERFHAAITYWTHYIFIFGGRSNVPNLHETYEIYNIKENKWNSVFFKYPRAEAVALTIENKIYIIGGEGKRYIKLKDCIEYDPITKNFKELSSMNEERAGHMSCVIDACL